VSVIDVSDHQLIDVGGCYDLYQDNTNTRDLPERYPHRAVRFQTRGRLGVMWSGLTDRCF
jgi:hypothetical protein